MIGEGYLVWEIELVLAPPWHTQLELFIEFVERTCLCNKCYFILLIINKLKSYVATAQVCYFSRIHSWPMFTGQNHKDGLLHWLSDKQVEEGQLISSNPNTTI